MSTDMRLLTVTIFIKWVRQDFIIHCLFVDDMHHTSTSKALIDEFMVKYSRDFEITGGELMYTFFGLQVDHGNDEIHMHMDTYVHTVLDEYKTFARKTLRPDCAQLSSVDVRVPSTLTFASILRMRLCATVI